MKQHFPVGVESPAIPKTMPLTLSSTDSGPWLLPFDPNLLKLSWDNQEFNWDLLSTPWGLLCWGYSLKVWVPIMQSTLRQGTESPSPSLSPLIQPHHSGGATGIPGRGGATEELG